MGFARDDEDVRRGLDWFIANQPPDGLWEPGYGAGKGARTMQLWVVLAVCRVLRRFQEPEDQDAASSGNGARLRPGIPSKSTWFNVTRVSPFVSAVAAIMASGTLSETCRS